MSTNYILFGWIYDDDVPEIRTAIRARWYAEPLINEDNNGRSRESFRVIDNYPRKDEFNRSFTLNLYQSPNLINLSAASNLNNEGSFSKRSLRRDLIRPITVDFDSFSLSYVRTSLPMLEQLAELCSVLQPLVIFSISHDLLFDPEIFHPPKYDLFENPSIQLAAEYNSGLCCISEELLKNTTVETNKEYI